MNGNGIKLGRPFIHQTMSQFSAWTNKSVYLIITKATRKKQGSTTEARVLMVKEIKRENTTPELERNASTNDSASTLKQDYLNYHQILATSHKSIHHITIFLKPH